MKLMHEKLERPIEWEEGNVNIVVIEHHSTLTEWVMALVNQCNGEEGDFSLFLKLKELDFSKSVEFVLSPFQLDLNQKRVITKLHVELKQEVLNGELQLPFIKLCADLNQFFSLLSECSDFEIEFETKYDVLHFLKFMDVKLPAEVKSLAEQVLEYIRIVYRFCGISVFIFLNLKSFLSDEELIEIYKFVAYEKIHLLILEGHDNFEHLPYEKYRVIDKDLCEI